MKTTAMKNRITKPNKRVQSAQDLLDRTELNPETGCRLWTYSLDTHGYGHVAYQGKVRTVTRLIWELALGPIPPGQHVLHDCDRHYPPGDRTNRRCIALEHLRLGTNHENSLDSKEKRRHWAHFKPECAARGERSGVSKLTERDVVAIRTSTGTHAEVAKLYGISKSNVAAVRQRVSWKHVP